MVLRANSAVKNLSEIIFFFTFVNNVSVQHSLCRNTMPFHGFFWLQLARESSTLLCPALTQQGKAIQQVPRVKSCEQQVLKCEIAVGTFPQVDLPTMSATRALLWAFIAPQKGEKMIFGTAPPTQATRKRTKNQRQRKKETQISVPLKKTSAGFMALKQTSLLPPTPDPSR